MNASKKIVVKIDRDIEEIIPVFLSNREEDISNLKNAQTPINYEIIESIAHKLAGNAGSYGFRDLGTIGSNMEKAAQAKEEGKVLKLIELYEKYMNNLEIEFV